MAEGVALCLPGLATEIANQSAYSYRQERLPVIEQMIRYQRELDFPVFDERRASLIIMEAIKWTLSIVRRREYEPCEAVSVALMIRYFSNRSPPGHVEER